jgi:N-acetylglucosamine malate deacetylase 1
MKLNFKKTLVLAAHPDDEMGCGGLITKLHEAGCEVHHYYFSDCAISTKARGFDPQQLLDECEKSRDVLGISNHARGRFDFPVRRFPSFRQEILEQLVFLKEKIRPDLVLTTATTDFHQDHKALTEEALRAFKGISILGYELPWNNREFRNSVFVQIERRQLDVKIASVQCYATQKNSIYTHSESIESIARYRGLQAGCLYAECYEAIRIVT